MKAARSADVHMTAFTMKTTVLLLCVIGSVFTEPLKFQHHDAWKPQRQSFGADDPKQAWSYVDVRESAHMFYWLYYTTNPAGFTNTPLVMWLQGGPGGSGTGFGNFEEIGPLDVNLNPRNTTWLQSASLLFVDNPVGTGYSYVDHDSAFTHDVAGIAADMMVVLNTVFMQKAKEFQTVPFYIFSESYGGKMSAAISQLLYKTIKAGDIVCNFKGVAMGDSWISPVDSTITWAPYLYVNSLVDQTGLERVNQSAQRVKDMIAQGQWTKATDLWGSTQTTVVMETNGVNFYNILKWGQSEPGSLFAGNNPTVQRILGKLHQDDLAELMNGKIRQKLGIIPNDVTWGGQSNKVFATQSEDFMKPVTEIVDDLIQNTDLKVIVYSGQLDLIVDTMGTENWVYKLKIADQFRAAKRKPILDSKDLTSAFVKTADNFSFYWILDAGHMIPADQGQTALKMLEMIIDQQ